MAEYGDTFEEAYELAIDAIKATAEVFAEKGKPLSGPLVVPGDFSGRITLRLPKALHRTLVESAEEQGVSLNQYLVNIFAYFFRLCRRRRAHLRKRGLANGQPDSRQKNFPSAKSAINFFS